MINGLVSSGSNCWLTQFPEYLMALSCTSIISLQQSFYTVTSVIYYPQRVVYNALCWGPSADLDTFPGSPLSLNYVSFCNGEFSFVNCEQRSCLHVHRSHKYLCFIWLFSQAIESKDTPQHHRDTNSLRSFFNIFFTISPMTADSL